MTDSVADRLSNVRARLENACAKAGRDVSEVTLVAVSKRQPLDRVRSAVEAGQRIFGENQVQEAVAKSADLPANLQWHLIGPLQSNKVKSAVRLFDVVHTLGRSKIARLLDKEAAKLGRTLEVFAQINIGEESSKHGFLPAQLEAEVRPLIAFPNLRVVGLMAIPPQEKDAEGARRWFRRLRELRDTTLTWPEWKVVPGYLSMGMSLDAEVAVEEGATHIRVGTDIFGRRPG